jgi:hypothetical protein
MPIDPEHPQRVFDCTLDKLVKRMGGAFFADIKYDGERLLCLKQGRDKFSFYSRNMLQVPERKLDHVRTAIDESVGADAFICFDAEIISQYTFGTLNKISKDDMREHPRIYIFDVLWFNGHNLTELPLLKRREITRSIVKVVPRKVELGENRFFKAGDPTKVVEELGVFFAKCCEERLEGLVLKPAGSPYRFGGTDWAKLKPGYVPGTVGPTSGIGGGVTRFAVKHWKGDATDDSATSKLSDTLDLGVASVDLRSPGGGSCELVCLSRDGKTVPMGSLPLFGGCLKPKTVVEVFASLIRNKNYHNGLFLMLSFSSVSLRIKRRVDRRRFLCSSKLSVTFFFFFVFVYLIFSIYLKMIDYSGTCFEQRIRDQSA